MAIPAQQLEIWSHQGSITQSSNTYNAIKNVLNAAGTPYAQMNYDIFLQGSYGNSTNIYAESDVDIVIKLNDCFQHDLTSLPAYQREEFQTAYPNADYSCSSFRQDVFNHLRNHYGADASLGRKAITISANGSRRKADVIVAIQYRRYQSFNSITDESYVDGICFYSSSGEIIINYPKLHAEHLTLKHQATSQWLKPVVRILKNIRRRLIAEGMIGSGTAPSYYLEGLLYNVPSQQFGGSYENSIVNAMNWILSADRERFVCANEQYYLLHNDSSVTWRADSCNIFLNAFTDLWKQW